MGKVNCASQVGVVVLLEVAQVSGFQGKLIIADVDVVVLCGTAACGGLRGGQHAREAKEQESYGKDP